MRTVVGQSDWLRAETDRAAGTANDGRSRDSNDRVRATGHQSGAATESVCGRSAKTGNVKGRSGCNVEAGTRHQRAGWTQCQGAVANSRRAADGDTVGKRNDVGREIGGISYGQTVDSGRQAGAGGL